MMTEYTDIPVGDTQAESISTPTTTSTTTSTTAAAASATPEVVSFTDDFVLKPMVAIRNFTLLAKIHICVGLLICVISFLVWHYVAPDPSTSFWWWIYPWLFFAMTLSAPIHYERNEYWKGIVTTVILINFMLFLTNGLTSGGFPHWWIYPAGVSSMILVPIYYWKYEGLSLFATAFYEYFVSNALLFLAWLDQHYTSYPWWIFPLFVLAIPLVFTYMKFVYGEERKWVYAVVTVILLNIMVFVAWGFVDSNFPWFLAIWVVSAGVVGYLWRRNNAYDAVQTVDQAENRVPKAEGIDPWSK